MLEIKTVRKGAELVSAKYNNIEKIHDGESFWNRHAPILFPIVGKLKNGKTEIEGKTYEMGQHGFARDMEFEEIGENSYLLKSNEETLKKFPFQFELYVSYEVKEDELYTKYKVINKDTKNMKFGLGGHPAFKCEYASGQYRLEFENIEDEIEFYQLEDGLLKEKPENPKKFLRENRIFLDNKIFENDAIIMKNLKSDDIYLKTETKTILRFNFKNFPYLAIWSKKDAPFLCIEPWFNTADKVNSNGIFEEKENLIELKPNEEFETEYSVKFF
jgi:galactose mutarotase-like enzyme